jgi:primosomal protein N' (replication factor Y) (superfamily II helicase)
MYAEVIFPQQKIIKTLTYYVPERFWSLIDVGQAVEVPLKTSNRTAYVIKIKNKVSEQNDYEIKSINEIRAQGAFFDKKTVELIEWMSSFYVLPLYKIISSVLPVGITKIKSLDKYFENTQEIVPENKINYDLSSSQKKIYADIISSKNFFHLIHGVTGSGKTHIYLHLIKYYMDKGLGCFLLIPEIGLSFHLFQEVQKFFSNNIYLLHSALSIKKRRETWSQILASNNPVVIGTRSAIFAPIKNLGCIIIDEEQDTSYKQDKTPRYNAKAIAYKIAQLHSAKLIMGSATPSINTMYQTRNNYRLHNINSRFSNVNMPIVKLINLKGNYRAGMLTKEVILEMQKTLQNKEQVLVLYNKRGSAKLVRCKDCGHVVFCPSCSISLTLHENNNLKCHFCDYKEELISVCKKCGSKKIEKIGKGIQALEKELKKTFAYANVKRIDSDLSMNKDYLQTTIQEVQDNAIDILVGTQIIAKGYHFPNIAMVVVADADIGLFVPDFYANERTFSLIVQVLGRAGREKKQGRVFIQTYQPDHYAIKYAVSQDYYSFYKKELEKRQEFHLPPFYRIIRVIIENFYEKKAEKDIHYVYKELAHIKNMDISEPFPSLVYKIKNKFSWNILIKFPTEKDSSVLKEYLLKLTYDKSITSRLIVDIDPISYF